MQLFELDQISNNKNSNMFCFGLESTQLKDKIAFANHNLHWKWKLREGLKATNNFSKIQQSSLGSYRLYVIIL
jgi:hypothetical protein